MPAEQAREVIERELGVPLEAVFEWIELDTPLGSASISQVGPGAEEVHAAALRCLCPVGAVGASPTWSRR